MDREQRCKTCGEEIERPNFFATEFEVEYCCLDCYEDDEENYENDEE